MELKKYKLGEFVQSYGDGIHGTPEYNESGEYYFTLSVFAGTTFR